MSVTAFPVLARILQERNLLRTKVGAVTIACAAVDDITAWAILAVVIAMVRAHSLQTPLWLTVLGSLVYVMAMIYGTRPALRSLEAHYHRVGRVTKDLIAIVLLLASGTIMPKDRGLVHELDDKLGNVTMVLLLPIFFASAGLRTPVDLVSGAEMWGFFGLIMLVAVAGKFGGSRIAARATGMTWRESSALGILMNTRGLMELVILTIGLDLGVISPALFAMMVMMALLTTVMTTPALQWLYPLQGLREAARDEGAPQDYTVLLPVSLPASGPGLLRVARALVARDRNPKGVLSIASSAVPFATYDACVRGRRSLRGAQLRAVEAHPGTVSLRGPRRRGPRDRGPDRRSARNFSDRPAGDRRKRRCECQGRRARRSGGERRRRTHAGRCEVVRSDDALATLVQEVRRGDHNLVVIGVAKEWGLSPTFFGLRHERLAQETAANLLVLRRPVTNGAEQATESAAMRAAREAHEANPTAV